MKKIKRIISGTILSLLALGVFAPVASANPSSFLTACQVQTAAATSTISLMTPNTATTTLTFDSYCSGSTFKTDQASLLAYFNASSTASIVNINVEYSQNNSDWFQDAITSYSASTSQALSPNTITAYTWKFASSTAGLGALPVTNNFTPRIFNLLTPTRYTRVIFSVPIGASNGGVWAQIVPVKQVAEGH